MKARRMGMPSAPDYAGLNREQRRILAKQKRPGETYADILRRQKIEDAAINREVDAQILANNGADSIQRILWLSCVALNRAFGFGSERWCGFLTALQEVSDEFHEMVDRDGSEYAVEKLRQTVCKISGKDVETNADVRAREAREA